MISWFKIIEISYGWFGINMGKGYVECSDFLNYDMPKKLLCKLINVLKDNIKEEWLYLMNEPGAEIMHIFMEEGNVHFKVYPLSKPSFDLEEEEEKEKGNCSECRFELKIDVKEAVDGLVTEFALYQNGNGRILYEKHWGNFPVKEFEELKKYAFELCKNVAEYDEVFCTTFLTDTLSVYHME